MYEGINKMKRIILLYHQIDEKDKFMSVTLENFKKQIDYLVKQKFNFCDIEELLNKKKGKHVCIMFDDGYKSIMPALEYLKKEKLNYSIAVIENNVGKKTYLSKNELDGTLYFHTKNHLDLTSLSANRIKEEIKCDYDRYSKCIVYPMGKYNKRIIEIVKENYNYGLSLLPFHVSKKSKKYELPRICVNGYLTFPKFKLFVSKLGNIYLHLAFIKRKILKQDYLSK